MWAIWCKSLGSRISDCEKRSDIACYLRTGYAILGITTSIVIIAGNIHNW